MSIRKETRARYLKEMQDNPLDNRHGKLCGYLYGCTCDKCSQVGRAYQRERYVARQERERGYLAEMEANPNDPRHGTKAGYAYGHRCARCCQAASKYYKEHYREETKPKPPSKQKLTARDIFLRERNLYRQHKRAQEMLANMKQVSHTENGIDARWEI